MAGVAADGSRDGDYDAWRQGGAGKFVKVNDGGALSGCCASAGVFGLLKLSGSAQLNSRKILT